MGKRILAVTMALMLVLTLSPAWAFAANNPETIKVEVKKGTVVEYFDIYKGATTSATLAPSALYKDFLTKPGYGTDNLFTQWSGLGYTVLRDNGSSFMDFGNKKTATFDSLFGKDGNYFDLIDAWKTAKSPIKMKSDDHGKEKKMVKLDRMQSTGLREADNLKAVETEMGKLLAGLEDRKLGASEFVAHNPVAALDDTRSQPVLYALAASFDKDGGTAKLYYNCFGIVFYDFKQCFLDDGNPYNIPEGALDPVPVYEITEDKAASTKNLSDSPVDFTYTKGIDTSYEITNEVSQSKGHEYTHSVGVGASYEYKFSRERTKSTPGGGTTTSTGGEHTFGVHIDYGFSAMSAVETAQSEGKTYSDGEDETSSVTIPLPAHTVGRVEVSKGHSSVSASYDAPVGISYKVAVVSMNGEAYDDGSGTHVFDTAGYYHYAFHAVFGGDYSDTVEDAVENLYNRAVAKKNVAGYDKSHGDTKGEKFHNEKKVYDKDTPEEKTENVSNLNWTEIQAKGAPQGYEGLGNAEKIATRLYNARPMSYVGATITEKIDELASDATIEPLYPLAHVRTERERLRYEMNIGDELFVHTIKLEGYDESQTPYYGFEKRFGTWSLADVPGNPAASSIATLTKGSNADEYRLKAIGPGTGYLSYEINPDTYSHYGSTQAVSPGNGAGQVRPLFVQFTVLAPPEVPFTGEVVAVADGTIGLVVGDEPVDIDDIPGLRAEVYDDRGVEIEADVVWESKELASKGIQISDNTIRATKAGTFHIRATYEGVSSEWVEIIAEEMVIPEEELMEMQLNAVNLANLTREDLAFILYKLSGDTGITDATGFGDIDREEVLANYKEAITWAKQNGVINGYPGDEFRPKTPATKEEFITIVHNFAGYLNVDTTTQIDPTISEKIDENDVSTWAKTPVEWAISKGLITEDDLADMKAPVTIDEMDGIVVPVAVEGGLPIDTENIPQEEPSVDAENVPQEEPVVDDQTAPQTEEPATDNQSTPQDGGTQPPDAGAPQDGGTQPPDPATP